MLLCILVTHSFLFRYILRIEVRDDKDVYDPRKTPENAFFSLFSFATHFVYLLKKGLETYNTPRFRGFARLLGRQIRQTVQFITDHWEAFKAARSDTVAGELLARIQVEYDQFFLRAARSIFSSQKTGAWQYLSDIPYEAVSREMLWKIFYILHLNNSEDEIETAMNRELSLGNIIYAIN